MPEISYAPHRFPAVVIHTVVWHSLRFSLSYRDVEDLLAARALDISYETIRSWVLRFGQRYDRTIRRQRPSPHAPRHLDAMVVSIDGQWMTLWRAVGSEGKALDLLVRRHPGKKVAARKLR